MNHRLFFEYLVRMLRVGVPLLRTLEVMTEERSDATWTSALRGICHEIETGSSLSDAMARRPDCFPTPLPRLVALGEQWGTLDQVAHELTGDNGRRFWADVGRTGNGSGASQAAVSRMLWRAAACATVGMPILEVFQLLAEAETEDRVREALITTADLLACGEGLTESLAGFPDLFSPATLATIEYAERAGDLVACMRAAADAIDAGVYRPRTT